MLYSIVTQAVHNDLLDPILLSFPDISTKSDGTELLEKMEETYNVIKHNYVTQDRLYNAVKTARKETTETSIKYVACFTESVTALSKAVQGGGAIQVPPPNMLAFYLVKGLGRPNDFKDMLLHIQADTALGKTYYRPNNLRYTMAEAEKIITNRSMIQDTTYCQVVQKTTPARTTPSTMKSTTPGTRSSNKTTEQQTFHTAVSSLQGDAIAPLLRTWYNKNKARCAFNHGDHKFYDCIWLKTVLKPRQAEHLLDSLKPKQQPHKQVQSVKAKKIVLDEATFSRFKQWEEQSKSGGSSTHDGGISEVTSDFSEGAYSSDDNTSTSSPYLSKSIHSPSPHSSPPSSILRQTSPSPTSPSTSTTSKLSVSFAPSTPGHTCTEKTRIICKAKYVHDGTSYPHDVLIPDSGCTHHLFYHESYFEYIVKFPEKGPEVPYALMGDDTTAIQIKGYGMVNLLIKGIRVRFIAYYTPSLQTNLLSIKEHI